LLLSQQALDLARELNFEKGEERSLTAMGGATCGPVTPSSRTIVSTSLKAQFPSQRQQRKNNGLKMAMRGVIIYKMICGVIVRAFTN
jgi:hypothetical protein